MKKITVIGTGYVGLVSGTCFADIGNKVVCADVNIEKINMLNNGIIPIYEPGLKEVVEKNVLNGNLSFTTNIDEAVRDAEIIYIAVGTPMSNSGEADLQYVKAVAKTIGQNLNNYKVIVNKSTVPVGTADRVRETISSKTDIPFDVVSNPEFLREGFAVEDSMNPSRVVVGASSERAKDIMSKNPKVVSSETMAVDALNILEDFSITQLIVADNGEYKGVLHLHDILKEGIV